MLSAVCLTRCATDHSARLDSPTRAAQSEQAENDPSDCQNIVSSSRGSAPLEEQRHAIYGGVDPREDDPFIPSTIALFSQSDSDDDFALIDGSATLISPTVALGAAHTCDLFNPRFASVGRLTPSEAELSFEEQLTAGTGQLTRITRCVPHPEYEKEAERPNDIALFYLEEQLEGSRPAALLAPSSALPSEVTIVGYGARSGQFDRWWEEIEPYRLQRVDTWISALFEGRGLFMDGPNKGHGSCQGDSGGPIYRRLQERPVGSEGEAAPAAPERSAAPERDLPVLLGSVVMGPECDEGIGYNTDLRQYIEWIKHQEAVELKLVEGAALKEDELREVVICP